MLALEAFSATLEIKEAPTAGVEPRTVPEAIMSQRKGLGPYLQGQRHEHPGVPWPPVGGWEQKGSQLGAAVHHSFTTLGKPSSRLNNVLGSCLFASAPSHLHPQRLPVICHRLIN